MAGVVVVGGGLGGLASAARLAKLGHEVTLVEARDDLGGALGLVEQEGFCWDAGPTATALPAVLRDLFRKSGRTLDRELDLVPVEPMREHRFADGSVLRLPGGSRAAQRAAVDEALGAGLGEQWLGYTTGFADEWETLRRDYFERAWSAEHAPEEARTLLYRRQSLHRRVRKSLRDDRLRALATHHVTFDGHDPRNVPGWAGMPTYLEQSFGLWTVPGGLGRLASVLAKRLGERAVTVHTGAPVLDLEVRRGRVVGVQTAAGTLEADHVVCAVDPRRLPALAQSVRHTMPALPPVVCHLGLVGEVPELAREVVLHEDPLLVVRTHDTAPAGAHAWTVLGRGRLAEDIVTALARHRIDVRAQVEVRVDRSPRHLVEDLGGSPYGVRWQGRATLGRRLGTVGPLPGLYCAGAHAGVGTGPGAGVPFVGLGATLVAEEIGRA